MRTLFILLSSAIILAGCGTKEIECGDPATLSTLKSLVEDGIDEQVRTELGSAGKTNDFAWNASKSRALLSKIDISFSDVRTTKKDPSSTKRFCEATFNAVIPVDLLEVANIVRTDAGYNDMPAHANALGLKLEAGKTTDSIEYGAQPTDDGKKVFVEAQKLNKSVTFISELISANLIKPILDQAQALKVKEREDAEAKQAQQVKELQELQLQKDSLKLKQSQSGIKEANDQINIVWNAATADFRKAMLPEQRIWLKEREIDCKLKATSAPAESTEVEKEIVRLSCEIEMTAARTNYLKEKVLHP